MATKIEKPVILPAAGNKTKIIQEYVGRVSTRTEQVSIARMESPAGWEEPGQKPEFNEYTLVLKGRLRVKTGTQTLEIHAGEAVIVEADQWVQYSTPFPEGAEYIAICLPAFSPATVHRDDRN